MRMETNIVADSVGKENGVRLTSMEMLHPRVILAEVNTHRVMSKNGASSRAIPFPKMLNLLRDNYFEPQLWLENQPGMVSEVVMSQPLADECTVIWREAMEDAIKHATRLHERRASKQYINRLLEPFNMQKTLISSTRWQNFFYLRNEKGAMPEFQTLAAMAQETYGKGAPIERSGADLTVDAWHTTYMDPVADMIEAQLHVGAGGDIPAIPLDLFNVGAEDALKVYLAMASARAARTSYRTFEGEVPPIEVDLRTFKKLHTRPLHASPFEHQAFPLKTRVSVPLLTGNFHGFVQLRKLMPNEAIDEAVVRQ